jgi:alkaline phosphatase D
MRGLRLKNALLLAACIFSSCAWAADVPEHRERPMLPSPDATIDTIAFGSCADQDEPQPIWDAVLAAEPDLFIFLGDNIYADSEDPAVLSRKYAALAAKPGFRRLVASTPILATWDDHDFGENDTGSEYPIKHISRKLMLDFFNEPADSPRRSQTGGIYSSRVIGPPGRRVQIILLDLRWNRSPLRHVSPEEYPSRDAKNMGPYLPDESADAQLLGEVQWRWFEEQLRQPAELRLIGSSVQALAEFTGWEAWANFPRDRRRLLDTVDRLGADNLVLLSGDTHWAELMNDRTPAGRTLWEMTSSGLTEVWEKVSPNEHRVGEPYVGPNFGLVNIDWNAEPLAVDLSVHDVGGKTIISRRIEIQAQKN